MGCDILRTDRNLPPFLRNFFLHVMNRR